MDMETGTEDSDLLQTRPCEVVHAYYHSYPSTEGGGTKGRISKPASVTGEPVFKRSGKVGILRSPCVGEEEVVYSDSQFLAWATWVPQEIAEEDAGDGCRFDMTCAKCLRPPRQSVLGLRSGLEEILGIIWGLRIDWLAS